jgi:hypothetical protein
MVQFTIPLSTYAFTLSIDGFILSTYGLSSQVFCTKTGSFSAIELAKIWLSQFQYILR